jgi:amino acid transporter
MPRIVYSMASDGLIFSIFSKVLPKLKTPFLASIATGLLAALLATIFDLNELVEMLSIGTLMAYSLVSACVLILRSSIVMCISNAYAFCFVCLIYV